MIQATRILALTLGLASPAFADTGPYVVGEVGSHNINFDATGTAVGVVEPSYPFAYSATASAEAITLGGGHDFEFGGSPWAFGVEGLYSFVSDEQASSVVITRDSGPLSYLTCSVALAANGTCPPGGTVQNAVTSFTERQVLEFRTQVDYTAAALLTVSYAIDRIRLTAGAGAAFADVNVGYTEFDQGVLQPVFNAQGFLIDRQPIRYPAATMTESKTATGWAARAGVEYQLNDRIALGLQYQAADYGDISLASVRLPAYNVSAAGQQIQLRARVSF